jgi:hypothetical protein
LDFEVSSGIPISAGVCTVVVLTDRCSTGLDAELISCPVTERLSSKEKLKKICTGTFLLLLDFDQ